MEIVFIIDLQQNIAALEEIKVQEKMQNSVICNFLLGPQSHVLKLPNFEAFALRFAFGCMPVWCSCYHFAIL